MKSLLKTIRHLKPWLFRFDLTGKVLFCVVFLLTLSYNGFAPPPPPPPPNIPIDGGIGWLVAAGLAYGAKKTYDLSRKKRK